jgi:hypothetical protein
MSKKVYKGSVTASNNGSGLATFTANVSSMSQIKFNAVQLTAVNVIGNFGSIADLPNGPFFVTVDSIKPLCYDLINGNLISNIGGVQTISTGPLALESIAPIKNTSGGLDTLRSPITISIIDSTGAPIVLPGTVPRVSVSFSLWEVPHDFYSKN